MIMMTKKLSVASLCLVCGVLLPPHEPARSSFPASVRVPLNAGVDPCEPEPMGMFCQGDCDDPGLLCVATEVTIDADDIPRITQCECIDECHVEYDRNPMLVRCVNFCPSPAIQCELQTEMVDGESVLTCVCEAETCPEPAGSNYCAELQDEDCLSDDLSLNCLPLCVEMVDDGAGGLVPAATECSCISPDDFSCGPVHIEPLGEFFDFICQAECLPPEAGMCQVIIDGVATGQGKVSSEFLPPGSEVCCECIEFPPPECLEPAGQNICADLQDEHCLTSAAGTTCEPLCVTIEGVGGVFTPVAKLCDCIDDDNCGPIDVTPINDPPSDYILRCIGVCDPGEICEVFIDGHATGEDSVNASQVPVGSQVCCDCADDPPPDVCPLPPNDFLCEDLQAVGCVEDQTGEFCQASCVDYDPMGGTVAVATQCECGLPGDCHVVIDAAGQPSCEGTCADGTPCVPTEKDNPDDGTIEFCCGCCPTNDLRLDLTTGVDDDTGGLIAIGLDDDTWTVTCEPPSGDPLPRPAQVIAKHPAWAILPGSRWISANTTGPNGDYCYETCFCLDERARNPILTLELLADDQAFVFVNSLFLGQTPSPGFLAPTLLTTNDETFFRPGEINCITVVVANQFGVVTGFNLVGSLTVENGECCCGPTDDGSACEDVDCPVDTEECQPRCAFIDPLSQEVTVEGCECRGEDQCHPVVMLGADPQCVGGCPDGEECVETLIHDDNGVVIGICCDCEPQRGACCFDIDDGPLGYDTCVDNMTEQECRAAGGLFQGVGSECTIEACCVGSYCQDADPDCCLASMGEPQGLGTNCGNTECPEQTGACCDGTTGHCDDGVPESECPVDPSDPDNQYRWEKDTLCADLDPPCEEHTGACCDGTTGHCDDGVPESDCPVGCFGECAGGSYCDDPDCCVDPDNCPVCYEPNDQISIELCGDCFGECIGGSYCDSPDPDCCIDGICQCYLPSHPVSLSLCGDCFGQCVDGSYCEPTDNDACCIEPGTCICYLPDHPISIKLCGDFPDPDNQHRWEKGASCTELDPPCEEHTGACCDGTTGDCEDNVPESECPTAEIPPGIGTCENEEQCNEPCPAIGACVNADCGPGGTCLPGCVPSFCTCDENNNWNCTDDCNGICAAVPNQNRWEKDTLCSELDPPCTGECGPCPTDVNHDGRTGALDLGNVLGCWSEEDPCEPLKGVCLCLEANGDGCIGAADLALVLGSWGACCRDGLCIEGESCDDCVPNDSGFPNECTSETWCADGVDNDCDGLTDCDDPDCTGDPNCP